MNKTKQINDILVKNSFPDSKELDKKKLDAMINRIKKEQKLLLEGKYVNNENLKKSVVNL